MKKLLINTLMLLSVLVVILLFASYGYLGKDREAGVIQGKALPEAQQAKLASDEPALQKHAGKVHKQILFGDLHVHSTFSVDAFLMNLPLASGQGVHPVADACDYARYCSALDFWSINDHAESLTPRSWQLTKESIRQCNALTDANNPDTVAFLGYEWTNMDPFDASEHYGHKNVIFQHTEDDKVAVRPIFAETRLMTAFVPSFVQRFFSPVLGFPQSQHYVDFNRFIYEILDAPVCAKDIPSDQLPADCREGAQSPAELFRKLDENGHLAMVIPHGNSWGLYTPPEATWDKQLKGDMHNEKYQYNIEVYSGHGNSEEYRSWRAYEVDEQGNKICPDESHNYLPMCRQAGRIVKQRCLNQGINESECLARELKAQQDLLASTYQYQPNVPIGTQTTEWLDAGQCTDCFLPSYNHNPLTSVQYAHALGNFDDDEKNPRRFRFGHLAASDIHSARPGTGYKEIDRRENTESTGLGHKLLFSGQVRLFGKPEARSEVFASTEIEQTAMLKHAERQFSFLSTGGLTAVHTEDRRRETIWSAIERKEIYGTSGDRILLWFDLMNPESDSHKIAPMGSELKMKSTPKFQVKAVGAWEQKPGCPDYAVNGLSAERLTALCNNECFNPGEQRKLISRIEVVRIRPQIVPDENIDNLIEDVWLTHQCEPDPEGCVFEFEDAEFVNQQRETLYYVRAIQEPSEMVNGANQRCEFDEQGKCIKINPCLGSEFQTPYEDDCLGTNEERAWSSPIFVGYEL